MVSPALDRLASQYPELAARYPDHLVLRPEGVRSGDELFAYVHAPRGHPLRESDRALRVSGFGAPSGSSNNAGFGMQSRDQSFAIAAGLAGFLILPGLILLTVGVATASDVRDQRFLVLEWIGARRRTLLLLALLETACLALPGILAGALLWELISPHLSEVPIVGHRVIPGDLTLSPGLLSGVVLACAVATGLLSIAVSRVRQRRNVGGPRPDPGKALVTPLRVAPIVMAAVSFLVAQALPVRFGGMVAIVGILLTIWGLPLLLPGILWAIGRALAGLDRALAFLAGRILEWDPIRVSRPLAGVAALAVIGLTGVGYLVLLHNTGPSAPTGPSPSVVVVQWEVPRAGDAVRLRAALERGEVLPVRVDEERNEVLVGATCPEIRPYFAGTGCEPGAPYRLSPQTVRRLVSSVPVIAYEGASVRLVPRSTLSTSGAALVLDRSPLATLDSRVRDVVMRLLPAPSVYSRLMFTPRTPPLVPWIVGGMYVALFVLALGCLVSLVDRLLSSRRRDRRLLSLGVTPRRLTLLEMCLFSIPYAVAALVAFLAGLGVCWLIVRSIGAVMPWDEVGLAAVLAVFAGLLGSLGVGWLTVRSLRTEDPERLRAR